MSLPILLFYGFAFVGIIHSVIFSFFAISQKKIADLIITLFLFVQAMIILEYVFFWTGLNQTYHQLCNLSLTFQFLFGPLLLMYVDYTFSEIKSRKYYINHFIPAIVVFGLMTPYYFSNADLKLHHYKMIPGFILNLEYLNYFLIVHMTVYFLWIFIKAVREKRVGHIINWLKLIIGCFGLYIACYISYYVMVLQPWFTLHTDYFVSIGMCASIISIIYFAYGKQNILNGLSVLESVNSENIFINFKTTVFSGEPSGKTNQEFKTDVTENIEHPIDKIPVEHFNETEIIEKSNLIAVKYKNSGITEETGKELSENLKILMQKEKLYRESELKLETLASKLGIARHSVSQVINQYYGVNFFEYINILRIEEAKQLLITSGKNSMNIIEIAYQVGYSTKNTFNTAFRRITGMTPTEYRNQYRLRMN